MATQSPHRGPQSGPRGFAPSPARTLHAVRPDAIGLGGLLGISFLAALIWMPFSLYRVDILTFYLPWYTELGGSLRSFDIPGWLPNSMSGAPMAGDPQSGWGYIPVMVIFTAFPSVLGFKLLIIFHVLFAATSSYLYARNLGLRPLGAFTTGIVFTLGNLLERSSCCTIHVQVAIWIPFVFLCIDRSQLSTTRLARAAWLVAAGCGAGQMVTGWVGQGAYYGGLAVGLYMLFRYLVAPRRSLRWRPRISSLILAGLVIGAIAASLAATAVIPRLDVVSRSNLANLYDDGTGLPERTGWLFSRFVQRLVGPAERIGRWYLGIPTLVLALIAPLIVGWRRDLRFFWGYMILIFSLIVAGSPTIWLADLLPSFKSLHAHSPDRILIIIYIAPAMLAGYVVDAISDQAWRRPSTRSLTIALALPTALLVAAAIYVAQATPFSVPPIRFVVAALVSLAIGLAALRRTPRMMRLSAVAIVLLVFADPTGNLMYRRATRTSSRDASNATIERFLSADGAAAWLQDRAAAEPPFRYFGYDIFLMTELGVRENYVGQYLKPLADDLLLNNRGVMLDLEDVQGYNPVQIRRYVNYFRELNQQGQGYHNSSVLPNGTDSPLLDLLNVRYIVVPAIIPPGRPDLFQMVQRYPTVYIDGITRILENPDALPRAWIVHNATRVRTGAILRQFSNLEVDPRQIALIDGDPPDLDQPAGDAVESVEYLSRENDEIRLRVTVSSTALLVLSEIWDPNWIAAVDGRGARVYRTDYIFRGIVVEPGEHEIVLRYSTREIKQTLLLYTVPLAAVASLMAAALWKRRSRSIRAATDPGVPGK